MLTQLLNQEINNFEKDLREAEELLFQNAVSWLAWALLLLDACNSYICFSIINKCNTKLQLSVISTRIERMNDWMQDWMQVRTNVWANELNLLTQGIKECEYKYYEGR